MYNLQDLALAYLYGLLTIPTAVMLVYIKVFYWDLKRFDRKSKKRKCNDPNCEVCSKIK